MGFVNNTGIGATRTIGTWSAGGLTITTGTSTSLLYTIQPQTTTYHILGEDFEVKVW